MSISKAQFSFKPQSRGAYMVAYTSPNGKKTAKARVTDMEQIDAVRTVDYPSERALMRLRSHIFNLLTR